MQIVIDIDDERYKDIQRIATVQLKGRTPTLEQAIASGTPLPKGHGRILDEKDILDTENNYGGLYDLVDMPEYIAGVKAIIEADKAGEEE